MNNSSESQTQTRNPQGDINGNLQPNISNVQPNGTDSIINAQDLPHTQGLKVLNSRATATVVTTPDETPIPNTTPPLWLFIVVPIVLISILLLVARIGKSAVETQREILKDKVIEPAVLLKKPAKKKKTSKNKKAKKRK